MGGIEHNRHVEIKALLAVSRCGHPPHRLLGATRRPLARGCALGSRGDFSPHGCRGETALWLALWRLPKAADFTAFTV